MATIVSVALLIVTAIIATALWQEVAREQAATSIHLDHGAQEAGLLLDGTLSTYRNIAVGLAASPLLDRPGDLAAFDAHVRALARTTDTQIYLVGAPPEYRQLVNTGVPAIEASDVAGGALSDELRKTLERILASGQPQLSDILVGPVADRMATAFVSPVVRDGHIAAFVIVNCDLRQLGSILAKQPTISSDHESSIVDGAGTYLYRTGTLEIRTRQKIPEWIVRETADQPRGQFVGTGSDGIFSRYAFVRPTIAPHWLVLTRMPERSLWEKIWAYQAKLRAVVILSVASLTMMALRHRKMQIESQRVLDEMTSDRTRRQRLNEGLPIIIFHVQLTPDLEPTYRYLAGDVSLVSGWPASELRVADAWSARMPGGPIPRRALHQAALRDGFSQHEFDFRRADGRVAHMVIHFRRLDISDNNTAELVGYVQDISEARQTMARTVHAARLTSLGEMSAALAHELRQPLAIMSFAAENALDDVAEGDWDAVRERLHRVIDQSQRAGLVIDHLRAFARSDSADRPLEVVDIRAAIDGALTLLGGMMRQADVDINIDLDQAVTLVRAQPVSLEQVFVNLFMNAVDAMNARPIELPRQIRVSQVPGETEHTVCYSVADSGGGIPNEVLPRIFEPFVTTKPDGHGTGLGLSLCHGIMQRFGGSIRAHNSSDGAVFTLCFAKVETITGGN